MRSTLQTNLIECAHEVSSMKQNYISWRDSILDHLLRFLDDLEDKSSLIYCICSRTYHCRLLPILRRIGCHIRILLLLLLNNRHMLGLHASNAYLNRYLIRKSEIITREIHVTRIILRPDRYRRLNNQNVIQQRIKNVCREITSFLHMLDCCTGAGWRYWSREEYRDCVNWFDRYLSFWSRRLCERSISL